MKTALVFPVGLWCHTKHSRILTSIHSCLKTVTQT